MTTFNIPAGYKWVPVIPTVAMLNALRHAGNVTAGAKWAAAVDAVVGEPVAELLPCSHCNHKTAPVLTTSTEWAEESDLPVDEFDGNGESYSVMCDAHKPGGPGGCGACSGFRASEAEAIEAWNRRASLSPATGALKVADPIDSDEHPIWIAIIGWLNSEGSDASVAAVNAAIKAECAKREAEPITDERLREAFMQTNTRSYDDTYACFRDGVHFAELHYGITAASQVESEDKLTPWFSSDVKPCRIGVYQVRAGKNKSKVKWAVWNNRHWYLALPSYERALHALYFSNDMLYEDSKWRGLASNPKKANHD